MSDDTGAVESIVTPVRVEYTYTPGRATTRYLRGLEQGRILGQRCPVTGKVYVPPRGASPTHGVPTREEVELAHTGTVTSFSIVRVPSEHIDLPLPYVAISVLLDGADIPLYSLLGEAAIEDARMGMRVEAVWKPRDEWTASAENIRWFRPTGEPDVPLERFSEHL